METLPTHNYLTLSLPKEVIMENQNKTTRIHPLVAGAAIAVMLVSFTGIAAMTGLLPNSHSVPAAQTPQVAQVAGSVGAATAATSPAALVEQPAPAAVPALPQQPVKQAEPQTAPAAKTKEPAQRHAAQDKPARERAPAVCHSCGQVESVQAIRQEAPGSGIGIAAGAVLGGVLGNQVGGGTGRKLATVAGAVGGGYAGNEIEKRSRATTSYQVRVRMEDGDVRNFSFAEQPAWQNGDRVRVVDGRLRSRG